MTQIKKQVAANDRGVHYVEIYCDNDYPAREAKITLKIRSDEERALANKAQWQCPLCHNSAKVHWVHNSSEQAKADLSDAIARVNVALYKRENGGEVGVPLEAFLRYLPQQWQYVARSQ